MKKHAYIDSQGDTWQSYEEYLLHISMYKKREPKVEKIEILTPEKEDLKIRRIQKQLERTYFKK